MGQARLICPRNIESTAVLAQLQRMEEHSRMCVCRNMDQAMDQVVLDDG